MADSAANAGTQAEDGEPAAPICRKVVSLNQKADWLHRVGHAGSPLRHFNIYNYSAYVSRVARGDNKKEVLHPRYAFSSV